MQLDAAPSRCAATYGHFEAQRSAQTPCIVTPYVVTRMKINQIKCDRCGFTCDEDRNAEVRDCVVMLHRTGDLPAVKRTLDLCCSCFDTVQGRIDNATSRA